MIMFRISGSSSAIRMVALCSGIARLSPVLAPCLDGEGQTFGRREDDQAGALPRDAPARASDQRVYGAIVARRIVMVERQLLDPGDDGKVHRVLDGRVTPADLLRKLL